MTEPNNTPNESSDQESLDDVLRGLSAEGSEEEQSLDDILASLSEDETPAETPPPDADDLPNTDDFFNLEELESSDPDGSIAEPEISAQAPNDSVIAAASDPADQSALPIESVEQTAELESWTDESAINDLGIVPEESVGAEIPLIQDIAPPASSEPALPDDIIPDDVVLPESTEPTASESAAPESTVTDDAAPFYTSPFASPVESTAEPLTASAAAGDVPTEDSPEEIAEISETVEDSSVGDGPPEIGTVEEVSVTDSTADREVPSVESWSGSDAPTEEPVMPASDIPQVFDVTPPQVEETREPELPQFSQPASTPEFLQDSAAAETLAGEPERIASEPEPESTVFGETPSASEAVPMEPTAIEDIPAFSATSPEVGADEPATDDLETDDLELIEESAADFSGPELPNLPPLAQPAEPPVSVSQASIDTPSNIDLDPTAQPLTLKALLDRPRHRWMVPFGFILILVIIGGLGLIIFQGGQDSGADTEESSQMPTLRHRSLKI